MSSTCCCCRWVGTLATIDSACPRCGEKSWADGVKHAVTYHVSAPAKGAELPLPPFPGCSPALAEGLAVLAAATGTHPEELTEAAKELLAANAGMSDDDALAALRDVASAGKPAEGSAGDAGTSITVTEDDHLLDQGDKPAGG
jgi:hypothetical protein